VEGGSGEDVGTLQISIPTRNSAGYYKWPFVWVGDEPSSTPGGSLGTEVFR
jgi:hypothetical protein